MYEPESRAIWTDAQDEVYSPITKSNHTSNHATIWRWRNAFQNDFFSRMDWCVAKTYADANHPPVVKIKNGNELTIQSGAEVLLEADATDPDHNELSYNWWIYKEVGSYNAGKFSLKNTNGKSIAFKAPIVKDSKTMHIIVEVTDNGSPSLTRYQRVILTINP
jgi:hypothetical protein